MTRGVGKSTLTEALGEGVGLPAAERKRFEGALGRDLAHVRLHTDEGAARFVSKLGARAFAVGGSIAFAKGEYDPRSKDGKHLLAHEVAHAEQQTGAAPVEELGMTTPGDGVEANAEVAASAMVAGLPTKVSAAPMAIARKTKDEPRAPATGEGAPAGGGDGAPGAGEGEAAGEEIGELTADRIGMEPDEGEGGPLVPPHDLESGKRELAGAGQRVAQGGGEGGGAAVDGDSRSGGGGGGGWLTEGGGGGGAAADGDSRSGGGGGGGWLAEGGGGGGGGSGGGGEGGVASEGVAASIVEAQSDAREAAAQAEAEANAYKAQMAERRDRFDAEQQALTIESLKTMSSKDKRATLADLGLDPKKVSQVKDGELDGLITGKLEAEQLKTKILGMTPEELGGLSSAQKLKFLSDLGIDRADLDKAGPAKTDKLFDDVTKAAHVPGTHKVKVQIKGGLFGRSWVVTVKCDADGGVAAEAQKEGGLLSKIVGWVKAALPLILTVIAPLTGGASLIALSVYQTVVAIKSGDWLGAITGAASALVGVGALKAVAQGTSGLAQAFSKIASVAGKVKTAAQTAQAAMVAAKAKNAGSLLAVLSTGAAAFAGFASSATDKFAQTMTKWSERLKKWSQIATGGEKVVKGIQSGDASAAIAGAFETASAVAGGGKTGKALQRAGAITGFVNAGRQALQSNPPNYGAVADAAFGIAAQLSDDRKLADAQRIVTSANRLKAAWDARASNPAGVVEAALGLAEAVQLAKYDLEHDEDKDADGKAPEAERAAIVARYQRSTRVVKMAGSLLTAASARPPNYAAALDAVTGLVAEFTEDKRIDAAAVLTTKMDAWTKAIKSGDPQAIAVASMALFQAVDGLRSAIDEERSTSKQEAEAKLPPGEQLPEDGGSLPHVTPPSEPVLPGGVGTPSPALPLGPGGSSSTPSQTPGTPETAPGQTTEPGTAGQPGAAAPTELAEEDKTTISIIKLFASLADGFEHPTAKQLIEQWEDIAEQAETISKNGGDATTYQKALASLRLIRSTFKFHEIIAKEYSTWESKFRDPLDEAAVRGHLQEFGQFTRMLERLVRVAAIPEAFQKAADDMVEACGFKKNLSGERTTVTERLVAAANLVKHGAALHSELAWLGRIGQLVLTKLGGASAGEAIAIARAAINKFGADVARVVMRYVTPVLEKIAATEGGALAKRVAERVAVNIAEWGVKVSKNTAVRVAAELLGERLGLALRFGLSWPVAIAIEIGKLEAEVVNEVYNQAYKDIARWVDAIRGGRPAEEVKREIRGKSTTTGSSCDAFFRYAFHTMMDGAVDHENDWLKFLVESLPGRTFGLPPQFSTYPERTLLALDPPDLKMISAEAIKDLACEFIDAEHRRHQAMPGS